MAPGSTTPSPVTTAPGPTAPAGGGGLGRAARRGIAWSAAETWTVKATGAITFVIVSRQLQPSQFGLVALAVAAVAVLSLLNERGLASVLIRSSEISETLVHTVFWSALGVSTVLTGFTWLVADPLADLLGQPALTPVLRWLSASFLLSALAAVPDALLRRDLQFRSLALRGTAATLASSAVGIALALGGAGVWALVAQQLTGMVVGVVLLWSLARWRTRAVFSSKALRGVLGFAGRFTVIDVLSTVQDRGEDFLISAIAGSSALGSWTVGGRFVRILQESGASVVNSVAIPTFSRVQHDKLKLHQGYSLATTATGLVLFPGFLLFAVTSEDLVPWVLGPQWAASGYIAQMLALAAALGLLNYFDRNIFIVEDRLRPELWIMAATLVAQLSVVLAFAPRGLDVLATAIVARVAITVPIRLVLLNRLGGVPVWAMTSALRVFAASLVAGAGALAASRSLTGDDVLVRTLVPLAVMLVLYPASLALLARGATTTVLGHLRPGRSRRP